MKALSPSHSATGNPRRTRNSGRTLESHAHCVRTLATTLERLGRDAGDGSRGRINAALIQAETILKKSVDTDGEYLRVMQQHETQAKERDQSRLDVVA